MLRHLAGDPHAARSIDWANVADEIGDVAENLVEQGESRLTRGLAYVAKLAAEPGHPAARRWQEAASYYLRDARFWLNRPDRRAHASLDSVWSEARRIASFDLGLDAWHPSWPETLPFSVDELLADRLNPALLADRLRLAINAGRPDL